MVSKIENTEFKIITAARKVFLRKGMDGARMQEIADEAGINKSLLHYYFRSKDKLFDRVFSDTFKSVVETINKVFSTSDTLETFLENFIKGYTSVLREKPYIPNFVLHELSRNPQRIVEYINTTNFDKSRIISLIASEPDLNVRPYDPLQLIVDIIALCIFPFVARPIISGFLFEDDVEAYNSFLEERTQHIIDFVKASVFVQK